MTERQHHVLLAFELVTGLIGIGLLWSAWGWQAAAGIFFLLWSKNLHDRAEAK